MECVFGVKKRKWIIDLDGNLDTLQSSGLAESASFVTHQEAAEIERQALVYAQRVGSTMSELGLIRRDCLYCSMCTRHRRLENGHLGKISIHLTLHVFAEQHAWLAAWGMIDACLARSGGCVTAIRCIDDEAVKRNKTGQNMSVLYSSKPVDLRYAAPEPMFSYRGTFQLECEGDCAVSRVLFSHDSVKQCDADAFSYMLCSCLHHDFLSENLQAGQIQKRSREPASCNAVESRESGAARPAKVPRPPGNSVPVPAFCKEMLAFGSEGGVVFNFDMPSLKNNFPVGFEEADGRWVKIESRHYCLRFVLQG